MNKTRIRALLWHAGLEQHGQVQPGIFMHYMAPSLGPGMKLIRCACITCKRGPMAVPRSMYLCELPGVHSSL